MSPDNPDELKAPEPLIEDSVSRGEIDWALFTLVHTAEKTDYETNITLNVGGVLVSGILVGSQKFFEQLNLPIPEKFKEHYALYIHLKDAYFFGYHRYKDKESFSATLVNRGLFLNVFILFINSNITGCFSLLYLSR